jgi:fumarate hydratase class II
VGERIEKDSLGEMRVPDDALWGASTQRAVQNFPISGQRFSRRFLRSLGLVKRACLRANAALSLVPAEMVAPIALACDEVIDGKLDAHFPVDVYQTGSGTSTNMNANEVIANRATQLRGPGPRIHPNDHVNFGQSSNDVIPTVIHVAGATAVEEELIPALILLAGSLEAKAEAFAGIVKSGRTHLMDATPITLGQEFSGYAAQVRQAVRRAEAARDALLELALGGTAVGTGINRHTRFPGLAIAEIARDTGLPFREAANHFEAQGARDGVVEAHGQLNTIATSLTKIANDVRWLGSGPRTALYEIRLPETQPGSSIMPGKVNPVMSEMLTMVCARVMGNQTTVTIAGMNGAFELNVWMPVLADALLQSITLLANGARTFDERCVRGIEANREICEASVEKNLAIATSLAPRIGYDRAAAISKEAFRTGRTVREVAKEQKVLPDAEIDALLDPMAMTRPDDSVLGSGGG